MRASWAFAETHPDGATETWTFYSDNIKHGEAHAELANVRAAFLRSRAEWKASHPDAVITRTEDKATHE